MSQKALSLNVLRKTALVEGSSFLLLLFVAMPMKYWLGNPEPVRIIGMAHGWLFLAYVGMVIWAQVAGAITPRRAGWSLLAGILPFGTFINEPYLKRAQAV